jgi:hypothetical protein
MALYRPIVDISGNLIELPDGDYIKPNLLGSNIPTVDTVLTGNNTWVMGASFNYWTKTGNDLSYVLGNVGIGTILPQALGHFYGDNAAVIIQSNVAAVNTAVSSLHIGQKEAAPNVGLNANYRLSYNSQNFTISYASSGGITGSFSERLRIDSSGNVGIGGTSTTSASTVNRGVYLQSQTDNDIIGYSLYSNEGSNNRRALFYLDDNLGEFGLRSTAASGVPTFAIRVGNNLSVYSATNGHVGIGTDNPTNKLEVVTGGTGAYFTRLSGNVGVTAPAIGLLTATTTTRINSFGDALQIFTGAVGSTTTQKMAILSSGEVGIGVANPSRELTLKESYVLGWRYTTSNEGSYHRITGGGANPINFKVDYTSGVFTPVFTFDGNATNILTMLNGGNVGIGTPTPTAKLEINQDANETGLLVTGGSTGLDMARFVRDIGGNVTVGINGSGGDAQIYFTTTGNTFAIGTDGSSFKISDSTAVGTNDRLTIDSTGLVGIGVSSPAQALHVFTATPYQIQVQRSGVASALIGVSSQTPNSTGDLFFDGTQASQGFVFRSRDVNNVAVNSLGIDRNGNVGIGIYNPSTQLHIFGEAPTQTITATNLSSGFRLNITGQSIGYAHRIQRDGVTIQATSITGNVGIGNDFNVASSLGLQRAITGASTAYGVFQYGTIQSDVTVEAYGFRNFLVTAASSFNIGGYYHFAATATALGAGSSIGSQTGFLANSSLTGATNNFGFRGLIGNGAGRWNLYMDGTAYNLLAGRTFIGSTAENGSKVLQVNGGIRQTDVISGLVFANAQGEFATATAANIAATLGAGNYIQNQVAGPQASANFYIDGYGRADTFRAGQKGYLGTYTGASQLHGIWTLSSTYVIDTSLGTFGNQYGLAYGHTNNTGGVALPDGTTTKKPITGWGHQILFTENGIVRSGISLTNGNTWQAGQAVFGNFSTTLYSSTSYSIIHPTAESYLANNLQIGKTGTGGILRFRRPTDGLLAGAVGFIDNNTINITSFGGGGIISFTTSNTEKMRITDVGRLLVGYNADVNTYKVQINSGSATDNGLYVNGHIRATGNIIADGFFSGTSSDLRYKSNFEAVKVLNVIDKINVYSYNHKLYNDARLIGSVAQELEKHFPQLITKDTNGYLRVDNYGYSALALQLGKEIKSEVDLLKDRVKELEAKIQTLEKE